MARSLTVNVRIDGVRETLRALNKLPKDANNELRDRMQKLAQVFAVKAKLEAQTSPTPQASTVAKTVRARRDRVPVVVAGGTRRLGRRRVPAWKLLFGSEFGSNQYRQFGVRHQGREGLWFFPTVEAEQKTVQREFDKATSEILARFSGVGGV